jgi:hypothetical protein
MTADPELLLSVDREVTWLESRGTLRRVAGPMLSVSPGESLTWFDPLDGRPQLTSLLEPAALPTFATAVEWPEGHPRGLSGAAVCVGDSSAAGSWHTVDGSFSVDRGLGCLVLTRHQEEIAERLRDLPEVFALLAAVRESTIHHLSLDGHVIGLAFHCGMGASTNPVMTGLDKQGRAVAVLADLDLLGRAR